MSVSYRPDGEDILADCRLIGVRELPNQDRPQETVHFTATVRLGSPPEPTRATVPTPDGGGVGDDDVYRIYFHGPAYQVLERAWSIDGEVVGAMSPDLGANHSPDTAATIVAPRLVELCFQTAGVWEIGTTGSMALPAHIDRLVPGGEGAARPLHAVVRPSADGFDASVVDAHGSVVSILEGYRTVRLPGALHADAVAPLRAAMLPAD